MATETERKFLVSGRDWRGGVTRSMAMRQFYLARGSASVVRVRIVDDNAAVLTVKGNRAGMSRPEYEWRIDVAEAREMEALAEGDVIAKRRHLVPQGDLSWEIDVFEAPAGLVVAEIELPTPETEFDRPDWLGAEVTDDPRYYNAALAANGAPA